MRLTYDLFFLKTLKNITALSAACIFSLVSNGTSATVIDFDDLNPVYDELFPCWCDNPLYDQYLDKGILIHDAWVNGQNSENVMVTSNFATIEFIGELPTFLSLNITSVYGDSVAIDVSGPGGSQSKYSSGWRGWEEESTPVIPDEYISFNLSTGIKYVTFQGFYNMRMGGSIDNLTFTFASIPEPASATLFTLGLLLIISRRWFGRGRKGM